MPEFHEREPEHQAWKRAVLEGELELEEVDTNLHSFKRPGLKTGTPGAAGS